MSEKKRYKNAVAIADGYHIICPYNKCGHFTSFEPGVAIKGNVIKCSNCRKGIKIKKVI